MNGWIFFGWQIMISVKGKTVNQRIKSHPCNAVIIKLTKFFQFITNLFFHRMTSNKSQKTHLKTAKTATKTIKQLQQKNPWFWWFLTCGLKKIAPWGMTCHWITSSVRELQGSLEDLEADRSKEGATSTAFLIRILPVCSAKNKSG